MHLALRISDRLPHQTALGPMLIDKVIPDDRVIMRMPSIADVSLNRFTGLRSLIVCFESFFLSFMHIAEFINFTHVIHQIH